MAPHSSTLAWKIPWMEDLGRLQSMGSLRVGHDWTTSLWLFTFMHWRRKWQPTPVFLPGESQGRWSLLGCRSMGLHRVRHDWSDLAAAAAAAGLIVSSRSDEFLVLDLRRTHLVLLSRILTADFTWMSFYQVKEASFCSQFANFFGGGWCWWFWMGVEFYLILWASVNLRYFIINLFIEMWL